jgi:hypothetical protein
MKATVELRYPETGFAYVHRIRMVFAPAKCNRHGYPQDENTILLSEANWGRPNVREVEACRTALQEKFPEHKIIVTD